MNMLKRALFITLAIAAFGCGNDLNGRFTGTATDPQFGVGLQGSGSNTLIEMNLNTDGNSFSGSFSMPGKGWSGNVQGYVDGDRISQIFLVISNFGEQGTGLGYNQFQGTGSIKNRTLNATLTPMGQFGVQGATMTINAFRN